MKLLVQNPAAGVIGGIIKGLKGKADENANLRKSFNSQTPSELLESIFLKGPYVEPSLAYPDDPIEELSIGLAPSPCFCKAFACSAAYLSKSVSMQMT